MTTQEFISQHIDDDIRQLALHHSGRTDIDLAYALDQIAGRQRARTKLPRWAATEGIIYPPHISMEQCSSEQTAMYKAAVAKRLIATPSTTPPSGENQATTNHNGGGHSSPRGGWEGASPTLLIDLTGGFGVDFSYLAPLFGKAVYIERQSHLCDISRHNMAALGISQAEVICGDCAQIIEGISHATLIYADPARRSQSGGRTFAISDCTPDVLSMREELLKKADYVMLKLSPMLDWRKAAADMGAQVGEVHIVSVGNECKELLLVLSRKYTEIERIYCVNDGQELSFTPEELSQATLQPHNRITLQPYNPTTAAFLYEPNASLMKAGCFALIGQRYAARQVSRDSHLFLSPVEIPQFPGRAFAIRAVTTLNKRELKTALDGIDRANVAVRNFPLTADALRKKLKLRDGGDTYIFGTTTGDGQHVLFICEKHYQTKTIQS